VDYVDTLHIDSNAPNLARSILTKKLALWQHEKEYRVLKQYQPFVKVKVKQLIFGIHADERQKTLLSAIAKKFCPRIKIESLSRGALETGNVEAHEI